MEMTTVELKIPCQVEYIGVARLVILGVASRTLFSYDEIEDMRLAVGEACTSAIDRAASSGKPDSEITLSCRMGDDRLVIQVSDNIPLAAGAEPAPATADAGTEAGAEEDQGIGALLMEILVDEIQQDTRTGPGTSITMTKYIGR